MCFSLIKLPVYGVHFNFNFLGKLFLVIRVFCAFCQKVLDISRLAVRSHSLCFVMVSTLKTP